MFTKAITDFSKALALYHVWSYQAYHEISSKYKRTVLGSLWITGAMVATSLALAIMIGGIQKQDLPTILPYVMAGIMAFSLSGSYILNDAPEVYMNSGSIIKNHAYPYTYFAFESVSRVFIVFLHNLVAFYLALILMGKFVIPNWSLLPGLIIVYFNSVFWGCLASMVAARFRDLRFMLPFLSQMVFYLTPVFWQPTGLSGWRLPLIEFNPFYGLVGLIRAPMLGQVPPILFWEHGLVSLLMGAGLWLICFGAFRGKIAFWI